VIVNFYHLAQSPLERVLPTVCGGLLGQGERVVVVADETLLARLDEQLWTFDKESFLPHGRGNAQSQPILLSTEPAAANGAKAIALADGVWREEALEFERAYYFFDGSSLDTARGAWRALRGRDGIESRYWKQDERGKWVQGP
jgi:DNA polymerase-3 subunit chi